MQRWENGPGYLFLGSSDEQEELAVYLKDREAGRCFFRGERDVAARFLRFAICCLQSRQAL
jgi:hypothetical protein